MALYIDKGTEELTGKLEGFLNFYREKTGRALEPEELRKVLSEIYEQKKRALIQAAFNTETPGTLKVLIENLESLLPKAIEIEPEPEEIPDAIIIPPRKRKPKNG